MKRKRKLFALLVFIDLLGFPLSVNSQVNIPNIGEKNSVAFPSTNNVFSSRTVSEEVDLYTGKLNVAVPIYTIGTQNLSVPVSLHYVAGSGVKVQDVASHVGLGWQIQAGGFITRIVRGLPDEETKGYIGAQGSGSQMNGTLTASIIGQVGKGEIDGEPDLFYVSTPDMQFEFTFDQNGTPVFNNTRGIKIEHNLKARSGDLNNTSWTITGRNGIIYRFGNDIYSREILRTKLNNTEKSFVSTWYLNRISTPNGADNIYLEYMAGHTYSYNDYRYSKRDYEYQVACSGEPTENNVESTTYTFESPKYVSRIRTTNTELRFAYQNDRSDITYGARLASIDVHDISVVSAKKRFFFSHSYFGTATGMDVSRLRLDNIKVQGKGASGSMLDYATFTYNTSQNLPNRNSVEYDYLGYYNNNSSGSAFVPIANKMPNLSRSQANILTEIRTLTGEVTKFYYELNNVREPNTENSIVMPGLRIGRTEKVGGGQTTTTRYEYKKVDGTSSGLILNDKYDDFSYQYTTVIPYPNGFFCGIIGTVTSSHSLFNTSDLKQDLVGYSRVKVIYPNLSYSVVEFTDSDQYPDEYNADVTVGSTVGIVNYHQIGSRTSLSFKRGLKKRAVVYDVNGIPTLETNYGYGSLTTSTRKCVGVKAMILSTISSQADSWVYGTYHQATDYFALTSQTERAYEQGSSSKFVETVTNYTYSDFDVTLPKNITMVNSEGVSKKTENYYPQDMSDPLGIYTLMVQANMRSNVVMAKEYRGTALLSTEQINFSMPFSVTYVPETVSRSKGTGAAYTVEHFERYDNKYNVLQAKKIQGASVSYLWDYNSQYLTSQATNAIHSDIAYTSFEAENKGNWTYAGSIGALTAFSVTGDRTFTLSTSSVISKSGLSTDKKYVLTLWVNGTMTPNVTTSSGGTLTAQGVVATYGAWRMHKYVVGSSTQVSIGVASGSVEVDEFRLYPEGAEMVSYTYDRIDGLLSMTDARGVITRYEYDDYGRLKAIRDLDGHVIEDYQYNFRTY